MPLPIWTPPTHVENNTPIDSEKHNAEVVDNIDFLHAAKIGTLGRTGNLAVPTGTFVPVDWNFAASESIQMWSPSPYPERITPSVGGRWLVTVNIAWPPAAGGGAHTVRMQQQGVTTVGEGKIIGNSSYTLYTAFTAQVTLDGIGQYINFHVHQDSGSTITLNGGHRLDLTWLGAV